MTVVVFIHTYSSRKEYIFKHIFKRVLNIDYELTTDLAHFIAHDGPKFSYGIKPLGDELFVWAHGILDHTGIDDYHIEVQQDDNRVTFFNAPIASALPFDLFAASFYLITRYEEYLPQVKDRLGRFRAQDSLAAQHHFIDQPVIDIWCQQLDQLLVTTFKNKYSRTNHHPVKESHTTRIVIETPSLYLYKKRGFLNSIDIAFTNLKKGVIREFFIQLLVVTGLVKDPFDTYQEVLDLVTNTQQHIQLSYLFHLGENKPTDNGVLYARKNYQEKIKHIADYTQIGLRFTKNINETSAIKEKNNFEQITHKVLRYCMASFSILKIPQHYRALSHIENLVDYSMGYPDTPGYRAGTALPFYFYDLDYEVQLPIRVHPYSIHYKAIDKNMFYTQQSVIEHYQQQSYKVKAPFVIMLENDQLHKSKRNHAFKILNLLTT